MKRQCPKVKIFGTQSSSGKIEKILAKSRVAGAFLVNKFCRSENHGNMIKLKHINLALNKYEVQGG